MKVVQYLVKEVNQFPSDIECMRYIATIADKVFIDFLFTSVLHLLELTGEVKMFSRGLTPAVPACRRSC